MVFRGRKILYTNLQCFLNSRQQELVSDIYLGHFCCEINHDSGKKNLQSSGWMTSKLKFARIFRMPASKVRLPTEFWVFPSGCKIGSRSSSQMKYRITPFWLVSQMRDINFKTSRKTILFAPIGRCCIADRRQICEPRRASLAIHWLKMM